jgi:DNA topoisomerase-1
MYLIIVESPTKAKTLSKFLGSDYSVEATMGHIKDLPKSKLSIDVEHNFKPDYQWMEKRKTEIDKIKKQGKKATKIFIATDPDREGEAIASHVEEAVDAKTKSQRIVFHEITKEAVEEALLAPRKVDVDLVDAQTARRVLDRLVGYKLSPLLWKKVRRGLSAGRVQSVAVRLIVEREKEIEIFKPIEYWEIFSIFDKWQAQLYGLNDKKLEINDEKTAKGVVSDLEKAKYEVADIKKRELKKSAYPPFTTSTMTQASARLFGWSAKRTMSLAQRLYENGHITYHRTDSLNIAKSAVDRVRPFIEKEYGGEYLPEKPKFYKTTQKVAQEAHEAIRPTNPTLKTVDAEPAELKLYELIWKRFVACQMSQSIYDETVIEVKATKAQNTYQLRAGGQIMKFDGWRKVYGKADTEFVSLPSVSKGEELDLKKVDSFQKFTMPPARYNEASLIKTLEKLGIGRPSTYAPTISTIQVRSYVEKTDGKFFATTVGTAVNEFLFGNFADIVDYQFTAEMEDNLDKIADGKLKWEETIGKFFKPFEKKVVDVEKNAKRVAIPVEKLHKACPECKEGELVVRTGRFGKFISCSRFPDCKFTDKYLLKIDMKCPDCKEGEVILKKTQKGRKFYGCSNYPKCKYASWKNPKLVKGEEQKQEV